MKILRKAILAVLFIPPFLMVCALVALATYVFGPDEVEEPKSTTS